jgi:hypothetical protein
MSFDLKLASNELRIFHALSRQRFDRLIHHAIIS